MAGAADPLMEAIAELLGMEWMSGPWGDRMRGLREGSIQAGWICGLLYAEQFLEPGDAIVVPVAAPVMAGARYEGAPIYFGDLVVRAESDVGSISDLDGVMVAYNEPSSLSGYRMLLDHFGSLDRCDGAIASGSHAKSMRMVASGAADLTCIDSTLIDMLAVRSPDALDRLRVVASLGPYPAPPVVARPHAVEPLRRRLLQIHETPPGRRLLSAWGVARFAPVDAGSYRSLARTRNR